MTHREKVLSIIDKKYNLDDITKDLILADAESDYDECGNNWWYQIFEIGGEYFKVWGLNDDMDNDCIKLRKTVKLEPVTYWEEL